MYLSALLVWGQSALHLVEAECEDCVMVNCMMESQRTHLSETCIYECIHYTWVTVSKVF